MSVYISASYADVFYSILTERHEFIPFLLKQLPISWLMIPVWVYETLLYIFILTVL